jgi:hypothetical protein
VGAGWRLQCQGLPLRASPVVSGREVATPTGDKMLKPGDEISFLCYGGSGRCLTSRASRDGNLKMPAGRWDQSEIPRTLFGLSRASHLAGMDGITLRRRQLSTARRRSRADWSVDEVPARIAAFVRR